jgi:hypothetical protein
MPTTSASAQRRFRIAHHCEERRDEAIRKKIDFTLRHEETGRREEARNLFVPFLLLRAFV